MKKIRYNQQEQDLQSEQTQAKENPSAENNENDKEIDKPEILREIEDPDHQHDYKTPTASGPLSGKIDKLPKPV